MNVTGVAFTDRRATVDDYGVDDDRDASRDDGIGRRKRRRRRSRGPGEEEHGDAKTFAPRGG
jgi:hypothetical protein